MRSAAPLAWVCTLTLAACSGGPVETPVRIFDAGFSTSDGGTPQDAETDASTLDAETGDTGERPDAGEDAGQLDGAAIDSGMLDTGMPADGGPTDGAAPDTGEDAGQPDTGTPDTGEDAGQPDTGTPDTGTPDTGVDAGQPDTGAPDTGVDAGQPDTGAPDTGVDAGQPDTGAPDTGVDAGQPDTGGIAPPPSAYTRRAIDNQFRHGQHVNIVDADGDGDLDVIASMSLTDTVRLYLNGGNSLGAGNGTTWQAVQIAANNSLVAMGTVVDDFDGDTDLDVVGLAFFDRNIGFASPGTLTFFRRGATVNNWTTVPINVGTNFWGPRSIASGDLTGDGLPDIVTGGVEWYDAGGNVVGNGLRWHRNTTGNFALPITLDALLLDVENVLVEDVDRDGVLDILAVGRNNGEVVWYENNRTPGQIDSAPTFTRHVLASVFQPGDLAVAQMDADPAWEVVVIHDDSNGGAVAWYDAPANPRGLWTRNVVSATFGGTGGVFRVSVADLNADGFSDIVASSDVSGQVRAFVQTATGWDNRLMRNLAGVTSVAVGDLSGDGRDDVCSTSYENTATADLVEWYQSIP